MIKTTTHIFDGVDLIVPVDISWPHYTFKDFPHCCGAGKGWREEIVPESILFLDVTPACFIHDTMWDLGRTWGDFHYSNSVFLCNLLEINEIRGGHAMEKDARKPIILAWFCSVSGRIGARNFFESKKGG